MKKKPDLTRPKVCIKIPEVRLRLEDLGFLRSLANPDGINCRVGDSALNRLRFLDLIARASVPPTEATIRDVAKEIRHLKEQVFDALEKEEYDKISSLGYALRTVHGKLNPTTKDVLTESGKRLLADGSITVRARKAGCP